MMRGTYQALFNIEEEKREKERAYKKLPELEEEIRNLKKENADLKKKLEDKNADD
jgi:hypothetical protein